jgi:hypothetical protein
MTRPKTYYRRSLPHYHPADATFHIIFRLEGSLPGNVIGQLIIEREKEEKMISSMQARETQAGCLAGTSSGVL